jgi:hypothetical protein
VIVPLFNFGLVAFCETVGFFKLKAFEVTFRLINLGLVAFCGTVGCFKLSEDFFTFELVALALTFLDLVESRT